MAMRSRVELGNCMSGAEVANNGLAETANAPTAHWDKKHRLVNIGDASLAEQNGSLGLAILSLVR